MSNMFESIKSSLRKILHVFLFIISVILLVLMYPKGGRYKYEFDKGDPWMHKDLIAEFDFPIRKSDDQLNAERDSILNYSRPYFSYDSTVLSNQVNEFDMYFVEKKNEFIVQNFPNSGPSSRVLQKFQNHADSFEVYVHLLLERLYESGIIEFSETISELPNDSRIVILSGKVAREEIKDNVYTQKQAYEYISDDITSYLQQLLGRNYNPDRFFKHLNLYDFIKSNLFYDEEKTEAVKAEMLSTISTTKGKVKKGERIISQGDVVNDKNFRALESLKYEFESKKGDGFFEYKVVYGQIIFIIACVGILFLFLRNYRNEILHNTLKVTFILFMVLFMVGLSVIIIRNNLNYREFSILYLIPTAILPIIIKTFYDNRLALFILMTTILLIGFIAPNSFEYVFLSFIVGTVAIFSLTSVHRRGQMFKASALVILTYGIVFFGFELTRENLIKNIDWVYFIFFGFNGILVLLAYPLIYLFEKIFGFLSDVTLLELSDTNQKLLRELAESAPGSFQHSLQVSNLAESVIHKVGGNPLLVRTGALYHDIGKMNNPIYFTENQATGFNPHGNHSFEESAKIIISHVTDGVEIAKKHKLPQPIIDFITTHHGTTRVKYFYRKSQEENPDKEIDKTPYTYPGPVPYSKETAVLMMADAVEAASRSLSTYNEDSINILVETIIDEQFQDKQFDQVDFTFKDISTIKGIFKEKLKNIYHARIKYPKKKQSV